MALCHKTSFRVLVFLCFSILFFNAKTMAIDKETPKKTYYQDSKRGYYWYEVIPEQQEESEETEETSRSERKPPETKTFDELWNMYPDDFQNYLDQVQKYAVQYPTEINIERYFYVNMISSKKAKAFASVAALVGQKNPKLSTEQTEPITAPGRRAVVKLQSNEKDAVIYNAKDRYALVMFDQVDCGFCESQKGIMKFFTQKYQWVIRTLDIKENPDFASEVGVETTPTIILIKKGEKDYLPISSGVISMSEMTSRIYRSVRYLDGDIKPQQLETFDYELNTPADPLSETTVIGGK
jgi:conjugal transfer pilus assembly protein TraF